MALAFPDSLVDLIALKWFVNPPDATVLDQGMSESSSSAGIAPHLVEEQEDLNAIVPLPDIPAELLCRIFLFLRPPLLPFDKLGSGRMHGLGGDRRPNITWLFAMTHVCGYWRRVACEEPRLWDHLALPEAEQFKNQMGSVFIKRAGPTLPLHIQEPITSPNLFVYALNYAQWMRIRTLCITPCLSSNEHALAAINTLQQDAPPHLTTLVLDLPITSLPRIFHGQPRSLRHLTLIQVPAWDIRNDFSRLTHLKLASQSGSSRSPLRPFLELLRRLTFLEHLVLDNAGPITHEHVGSIARVSLDHLRSLELCDAIPPPRELLIHLALPEECVVHVARHWTKNDALFGSPNPAYTDTGLLYEPTIAVINLNSPRSLDHDRLVFRGFTVYIDTRQWSDRHAKGMGDVLKKVIHIYIGGHSSYAMHCGNVLWKWVLMQTPDIHSITFTTPVDDVSSIVRLARHVEGTTAKHLECLCFKTSCTNSLDRLIGNTPALNRLADGNVVLWRQSVLTGGLVPCRIVLEDGDPPLHPIFDNDGQVHASSNA